MVESIATIAEWLRRLIRRLLRRKDLEERARRVIDGFQLGFFKPHVDAYTSNPDNHPYLLEVYEQIEKVVKET